MQNIGPIGFLHELVSHLNQTRIFYLTESVRLAKIPGHTVWPKLLPILYATFQDWGLKLSWTPMVPSLSRIIELTGPQYIIKWPVIKITFEYDLNFKPSLPRTKIFISSRFRSELN